MINLIVKDFKLLFANKNSLKKNIVSAVLTALALACLLAVEVFVFTMLLKKFQEFDKATLPFLTLFLFIIAVLMMVLDILQANKLFFNKQDIDQLIKRPISNAQIVWSKLAFLFVTHYFMTALLVFPIMISYGQIIGKPAIFYYQGLFYPVVSFLFEAGIALVLVYPFRAFVQFLKKHIVFQFVVAFIVMVLACQLYSSVLNVFMELVINNNVAALFTKSSIQKLIDLRQFLLPSNFMADVFFSMKRSMIFPCVCIALGVFTIGVTIVVFAFNYFRSANLTSKKVKNKKFKIIDPKKALLKKELILLFKDSGNIFSFTGLLMVQPFLVYSVIKSLNLVFTSGAFAYYMLALPELLPLIDVLLIMLFTLIINQGANEYIQAEKGNIRVMKIIPIAPHIQMFIKVLVPFALSFISMLLSVLTLWAFGIVSFTTFIFSLILTTVVLFVFELVSLKEEMAIRNAKPRSMVLSSTFSYLLPFVYFVAAVAACSFGVHIIFAYLVGLALYIIIGLPFVYKIKKKVESNFLDLEMVN
jgi:hypothetical protein